ncbi:dynamin family protein [Clostridium sp. PL3]|uniref:Dynamin family protein n=1 Tax=Clostridium thailandense TaxID=2794346 RepID=A0A949TVJ2_9CLOT|nr:dynamin family protein [Clostridium thailandense]MBV7276117.1 dynamin family protein [Clostridium thailandense]
MSNSIWQEQKNKYQSILDNANGVINKILTLESKDSIMNYETEEQLRELFKKNNTYIDKLQKNSFEVAIVGLEKAGKSTFANALISNDVLPSASTRCTFTSTHLEYGSDEATVFFHSRNEFNNMFRQMLKSVDYSNSEQLNFDNFRLNDFERYFNDLSSVNPSVYKEHVGKTEEDIKDILKYREEISRYLDGLPKVFRAEELKSDELKEFITSHGKSRAVREIIIKSSQLENMQNIIVHDVPGFDSPTRIHEEQTLERLKNADAIILVTNVGETPNLLGTQLNLLLKESDNDGIKLNEKLFIFGNKIDRVNTKEDAERNISALIYDAIEKYKIVNKDKLFIGCAFAYLQKNSIVSSDKELEKIKEFGLDDNIDNIRDRLEVYHNSERFEILKKRINKNIKDLKDIFNKIVKENEDYSNYDQIKSLDNKLLLKLDLSSRKIVGDCLARLRDEIKKDIYTNKYFTHSLNNLVDESFEHITDGLIEETRIKVGIGATGEFAAGRINDSIRQKLYNEFIDKFTDIILNLSQKEAEKVESKIEECFEESLELSENNPYYDEVKKAVSQFIEAAVNDIAYDKRYFINLVERFSQDLFDILIYHSLGSSGRLNKFYESEEELYSLGIYYNNKYVTKPYFQQPFINIILAHLEEKEYSLEEIREIISKGISSKLPEIIKILSEDTILALCKEISSLKVNPYSILEVLLTDLSKINKELGLTDIKNIAETIMERVADKYMNLNSSMSKEQYINQIVKNINQAQNKDDVLKEINQDIDYLKMMLKEVVIKAICLEKPFVSMMVKQINRLTDLDENLEYKSFISDYAAKIKYFEFADNEQQKAIYENKKEIVQRIKNIMAEMGL